MSDRLAQVKDNVMDTKDILIKGVKESADTLLSGTKENLDRQMEVLSARLDAISTDVRHRLRSVDEHLHQKPYLYLLGVAAVGLGLGLLMRTKASSET